MSLIFIPNKSKVPPREYHATTLAMFLVNIVVEELKMKDGDPQRAVQEILNSYDDPEVTTTMTRFMYNGRISMPGDLLDVDNRFNRFAQKVSSVHNIAAMRLKSEEVAQIRTTIIDGGYNYLNEHKSP
jgi:F0F1-type ATP synthase delta subunit